MMTPSNHLNNKTHTKYIIIIPVSKERGIKTWRNVDCASVLSFIITFQEKKNELDILAISVCVISALLCGLVSAVKRAA